MLRRLPAGGLLSVLARHRMARMLPATASMLAASPAALPAPASAAPPVWDPVLPGTVLQFPRDHGAHPGHRIEWWYVTGWMDLPDATQAGFQVTFFRARTAHPQANPSRFAPHQLILAHAAIALPDRASLVHDERAARAGFDLAGARTDDTYAWIGVGASRWLLARDGTSDRYTTRIRAREFTIDLTLTPDGPPLLHGDDGFSRKGPLPTQASHYYTRPQMGVSGRLGIGTIDSDVTGRAWFDREWWSEILAEGAVGWDWAGLNLDDGTAVMAFRIRAADGSEVWRDATLRDRSGNARTHLTPEFQVLRRWRSARTGAQYPVSMRVRVAGRILDLIPMIDDQELDSRSSTGTIYWEGAVTVFEDNSRIGRGYLELAGYAAPVRF
jgi:predicted secreted hydrolase